MKTRYQILKSLLIQGYSKPFITSADLSGADLRKADLRKANLSRADLSRANLSRADLENADLREAYLYGADLSRANVYTFSLGKHFGFVHSSCVQIGCKNFPPKNIDRKMLKALGVENGYTEKEIKIYADIILRLIKEI